MLMVDEPRDEELESEGAEAEEPGEDGEAKAGPPLVDAENRAPSDTHRESGYLKELVQRQVPVELKLRTGETVSGFIEYYDKRFIRLTRTNAPNLFIFKTDILYLYETGTTRAPEQKRFRR